MCPFIDANIKAFALSFVVVLTSAPDRTSTWAASRRLLEAVSMRAVNPSFVVVFRSVLSLKTETMPFKPCLDASMRTVHPVSSQLSTLALHTSIAKVIISALAF